MAMITTHPASDLKARFFDSDNSSLAFLLITNHIPLRRSWFALSTYAAPFEGKTSSGDELDHVAIGVE